MIAARTRSHRTNSARMNAATAAFAAGMLCLLAGDSTAFAPSATPGQVQEAIWSKEKWPFPIDQWGTGEAFGCASAQCGGGVHVYLRAKIGFCRCATGVSDDDEIERVGDVGLIGADYAALAPGQPVAAGILAGRERLFRVLRPLRPPISVLEVALSNKCDAIVATVLAERDMEAAQENAALEFLRGDIVQHWAAANTGSRSE